MRPQAIGGMDVARTPRRRLSRRVLVPAAIALLVVACAFAVFSLARSDGGVTVDRAALVTSVVRRGTLERSVSAAGTLQPQEVHVVAAVQPGIIDAVFVKPGAAVFGGTPIARMSNPDLDAAVVSASSALDVARAQLRSAQAQAQAAALAQQSAYATARAQADVDAIDLTSLRSLLHSGYVAAQTYQIAAIKVTQSAAQVRVARSQIGVGAAESAAQIAAAKAQVDQAAAQLQAKQAEVAALVVRARSSGIVQSVAVDPGARVESGTELARIADQQHLKAVLQVAEGQVHDMAIGMPTRIDTGNGIANGRVARIAPAAQNGTVNVDVALTQALPPGARPDLTVDGTIDLQTLRGVLSIARPAGAADNTDAELYRLDPHGNIARLAHVRLGPGSADRIEVLSGLAAGDAVIVSDTSAYNGISTLRLH
ncbi:MAG TPA: efflux RND transporter periplasmic adaptor subunit [Candidatus Dormibacteraeota bacterium]|nr:efflux RND transporter periplasmic adaptor subunit [Candidatus Dormibacteraeota bacterium]